jgi:hypothetical protein
MPLHLQEINIDCHGNLTKCCHLSGHGEGVGQSDVMGDLHAMSFTDAYQRLVEENGQFNQQKVHHLKSGRLTDADLFPCWYCSLYHEKVGWLGQRPDHPWSDLIWEPSQNMATAEIALKEIS